MVPIDFEADAVAVLYAVTAATLPPSGSGS